MEADRFGTLARAVALTQSVVLLKGHRTLIGAPDERAAINVTGSGVLATGGSGDVLTGVLAAFGTLLDARRAAFAAAYVHGPGGVNAALEAESTAACSRTRSPMKCRSHSARCASAELLPR